MKKRKYEFKKNVHPFIEEALDLVESAVDGVGDYADTEGANFQAILTRFGISLTQEQLFNDKVQDKLELAVKASVSYGLQEATEYQARIALDEFLKEIKKFINTQTECNAILSLNFNDEREVLELVVNVDNALDAICNISDAYGLSISPNKGRASKTDHGEQFVDKHIATLLDVELIGKAWNKTTPQYYYDMSGNWEPNKEVFYETVQEELADLRKHGPRLIQEAVSVLAKIVKDK